MDCLRRAGSFANASRLSAGIEIGVVPADAGAHTLGRLFLETLFDDFLTNYARWLWVPHRASLVRDDGGGFGLRTATIVANRSSGPAQRSNAVRRSSLRAQRSNPCTTQGSWIASLRSQ